MFINIFGIAYCNYLLKKYSKKNTPQRAYLKERLLCRVLSSKPRIHSPSHISCIADAEFSSLSGSVGQRINLQAVTITHYGFEHDSFWSESVWICTQHAGSYCWTKARNKSSALVIKLDRNIAARVQVPKHYFW